MSYDESYVKEPLITNRIELQQVQPASSHTHNTHTINVDNSNDTYSNNSNNNIHPHSNGVTKDYGDTNSTMMMLPTLNKSKSVTSSNNTANTSSSSIHIHPSSSSSSSSNDWRVFQLGIRFGFVILLLFWSCWDILVDGRLHPSSATNAIQWVDSVLPVYRGIGCIVLCGWMWGIQCWIWSKYKINYLYLFNVTASPTSHLHAHSHTLSHTHMTHGTTAVQRHMKYTYMTYSEVFEEMTLVTIIYLSNFLIYYKILRGDFPPILPSGYFPIMLFLYVLYRLLPISTLYTTFISNVFQSSAAASSSNSNNSPSSPTPLQQQQQQQQHAYHMLWYGLLSVLCSPFSQVTFFTSYLGDILTSLVRPMVDISYTLCLLFSLDWMHNDELSAEKPERCFHHLTFKRFIVPLISALPLWFRLCQCLRRYYDTHERWPHLANATKYALSHSVVLMGVFHTSFWKAEDDDTNVDMMKRYWLLCLISSTVYNFLWDVYMDFGLGRQQHQFLRERLLYDNKAVYYIAMVLDLFMRFSWTLTLLPTLYFTSSADKSHPFDADWLIVIQPLLAAMEVIRRGMWSTLRIENEYIIQLSTSKKFELFAGNNNNNNNAVTPDSSNGNIKSLRDRRSGWRVLAEVCGMIFGVVLVAGVAAMTAN
jgi:hypothetical protein